MEKQTITIVLYTDADPSALLDAALDAAAFFADATGEACTVDDDDTCVE